MPENIARQILGQKVCPQLRRGDVNEFDSVIRHHVSNLVILHIDVLEPLMMSRIVDEQSCCQLRLLVSITKI